MIEHRLQVAGVALWASDEGVRAPISRRPRSSCRGRSARAGSGLAGIVDPTNILTRRVKQGVAEWYALDMIKRARDGFETHTDMGFNVGKAPYGYRPLQIRLSGGPAPDAVQDGPAHGDDRPSAGDETDPAGLHGLGTIGHGGHRGKGRVDPRVKTRLVRDPTEADTVRRIFAFRVGERLGYQAIADRLNADLALNPPPTPPDPARAAGRWTTGSVREVLCQPKYTGYMVWNRRAVKTRGGSPNPVEEWVWSSRPTHDVVVDLDTFVAAQNVGPRRERSRTAAGPNPHPHTKRSYLLRSHLFCALCGRRMFGKTRRGHAYYACTPKKGQEIPDGHPASLWVNEGALVGGLHDSSPSTSSVTTGVPCSRTRLAGWTRGSATSTRSTSRRRKRRSRTSS